jgi:hypothetical protein
MGTAVRTQLPAALSGIMQQVPSDLGVQLSGRARQIDSVRGWGEALVEGVSNKRFRDDTPVGNMLRTMMPGGTGAGMSVTNTGYSTLDQQGGEEEVNTTIILKAFPEGWQNEYVEKDTIWIAREQDGLTPHGMSTGATVPVLNFLLDEGVTLARGGRALAAQAVTGALAPPGSAVKRTLNSWVSQHDSLRAATLHKNFFAETPAEFDEKWSLYGNMHRYTNGRAWLSVPSDGRERVIGVTDYLRSVTWNVHTTQPQQCASVWWIVTECELRRPDMQLPNGVPVLRRETGTGHRALQVVGYSNADESFPTHYTSVGPSSSAWPDPRRDADRFDIDYIRRGAVTKDPQIFQTCEYDPATDSLVFRKGDDDAQELVANLPQLQYDAYELGRPKYAGHIKSVRGAARSTTFIEEALRDWNKMHACQELELLVLARV